MDYHTSPYNFFLDGYKNLEILRLEDIDVWWPVYKRRYPKSFGPLARRNSSKGVIKVPEDIKEEIESVYADDLALWRSSAWEK
jgi:hypothetical protein